MKEVKISINPFSPNLEVVDTLSLKVGPQYGPAEVELTVSPNVVDYQENADQPGVQVRQVMVHTSTASTQRLTFNLTDRKRQTLTLDGEEYAIELLETGREFVPQIPTQDFFFCRFSIDKK